MLTGSASKGRTQYYHYYHCSSACGVRYKATDANDKMFEEIKKYVWPLSRLEICKDVITSTYKSKERGERDEQKDLKSQLQEVNTKVVKARELLLCGDIEGDDYRAIKSECEEKINRLEAKLKAAVSFQTTIEPLWDKAFSNIAQLYTMYKEGSLELKRANEVIDVISLIDKELKCKKMGQVV